MHEPSFSDALLSVVPFLLVAFILFLVAIPVSRRRGKVVGFAQAGLGRSNAWELM
jgi:large-conductance mechanosensitive channel